MLTSKFRKSPNLTAAFALLGALSASCGGSNSGNSNGGTSGSSASGGSGQPGAGSGGTHAGGAGGTNANGGGGSGGMSTGGTSAGGGGNSSGTSSAGDGGVNAGGTSGAAVGGSTNSGGTSGGGQAGGGGSNPGSSDVTLTIYRQGFGAANAEFVAFQDGSGAWEVVSGTNGVYHGTAHGPRYGFASVCVNTSLVPRIQVLQMTVGETTTLTRSCLPGSAPAHKLTGTVNGLTGAQQANFSLGSSNSSVVVNGSTFMLLVNSGTYDFVAVRGTQPSDKVSIARDLSVTADLTRNVDFSTQGVALEPHAIAFTNLNATTTTGSSSAMFISKLGSVVSLGLSSTQWFAVPAAQLQTNDVHAITSFTGARSTSPVGNARRTVTRYLTTPADVTLDFVDDLGAATASAYQSTPSVLLEFDWDAFPSADTYSLSTTAGAVLWSARISAGWLGAAATYSYREPDLSNLPGYKSTWSVTQLPANPAWVVSADSSSRALSGVLFDPTLIPPTSALDGLIVRSTALSGAFGVY